MALELGAVIYYFYSTLYCYTKTDESKIIYGWEPFLDEFSYQLANTIALDPFSTQRKLDSPLTCPSNSVDYVSFDIFNNKPTELDSFLSLAVSTKIVKNPLTMSNGSIRGAYIEGLVVNYLISAYGKEFFINRFKTLEK